MSCDDRSSLPQTDVLTNGKDESHSRHDRRDSSSRRRRRGSRSRSRSHDRSRRDRTRRERRRDGDDGYRRRDRRDGDERRDRRDGDARRDDDSRRHHDGGRSRDGEVFGKRPDQKEALRRDQGRRDDAAPRPPRRDDRRPQRLRPNAGSFSSFLKGVVRERERADDELRLVADAQLARVEFGDR